MAIYRGFNFLMQAFRNKPDHNTATATPEKVQRRAACLMQREQGDSSRLTRVKLKQPANREEDTCKRQHTCKHRSSTRARTHTHVLHTDIACMPKYFNNSFFPGFVYLFSNKSYYAHCKTKLKKKSLKVRICKMKTK